MVANVGEILEPEEENEWDDKNRLEEKLENES